MHFNIHPFPHNRDKRLYFRLKRNRCCYDFYAHLVHVFIGFLQLFWNVIFIILE